MPDCPCRHAHAPRSRHRLLLSDLRVLEQRLHVLGHLGMQGGPGRGGRNQRVAPVRLRPLEERDQLLGRERPRLVRSDRGDGTRT